MANYLHHAVVAKAKKHGITLVDQGHGVIMATVDATGTKTELDVKQVGKWLDDTIAASKKLAKQKPAAGFDAAAGARTGRATSKTPVHEEKDKAVETPKTPAKRGKKEPGEFSEQELTGKSIVAEDYKARYAETGGHSCGDDMSKALGDYVTKEGAMDLQLLKRVAADNDIDYTRFAHLNPGQRRMNIGNMLRARLRKGIDVKIGTRVIRSTVD